MSITSLSSREFNQDTGRAKRAAKNGPVFITDRGRPAHVLLTIEDYQRLTAGVARHHRESGPAARRRRHRTGNSVAARAGEAAGSRLIFLLDTNVISELRKARAGKADRKVAARVAGVTAASFFLSAIVIRELEIGVWLAERRDAANRAILRSWLEDHVLAVFSDRIAPLDTAVARCAAALHVPDPPPIRDALIAATALVHGMALVTRNVCDFAPTGVRILDPWSGVAQP